MKQKKADKIIKKNNKELKVWMKKAWGKRCDGRCPSCVLCQAWDSYDQLTLNEETQPVCCEENPCEENG